MTPNFPIPYIENELRFTKEGIDCKGDSWQRGCASADGEPAFAIHTIDGKHYCPSHSPFDNKYVPCTRCGDRPVNKPESVEVDPICMTCQREMYQIKTKRCSGWGTGEDCGNDTLKGGDLCGDCHGARLDYESPMPGQPRRYPN